MPLPLLLSEYKEIEVENLRFSPFYLILFAISVLTLYRTLVRLRSRERKFLLEIRSPRGLFSLRIRKSSIFYRFSRFFFDITEFLMRHPHALYIRPLFLILYSLLGLIISRQLRLPLSSAVTRASAVAILVANGTL